MILNILLTLVSPIELGGIVVGGVIVIAIIWEKIRPVIIIKSKKGGKFFLGVSHSKKRKNMQPLTQDGIEGIVVDDDTCFGLANTPSKIIKEIGTVSIDKAQVLLDSLDEKKVKKIEKRNKAENDNEKDTK